jgi:N-methylhydantoinase A
LAKRLRVKRVIVPLGAGVMSAFGFLVAAPTVDEVRGYRAPLTKVDWPAVHALYEEMETRARTVLRDAGGQNETIVLTRSADMRYIGQGFEIEVPLPDGTLGRELEGTIRSAFNAAYRDLFGRTEDSVEVEMISWRLSARLRGQTITLARSFPPTPAKRAEREVYFDGFGDRLCVVYDRYALRPGMKIDGPAVFEERESSFIVGPDCTVTVDRDLNLIAQFQPHTGSGP